MRNNTLKFIIIILFIACNTSTKMQIITISSFGDQPSVILSDNILYVVFGNKETIYISQSDDDGKSFDEPQVVGILTQMMLGYSSGPAIASTKESLIVTAADRNGNLFSWVRHKTSNEWEGPFQINDLGHSAGEALMDIASTPSGQLFSVWIDTRKEESEKKKIQVKLYLSRSEDGKKWGKSSFVYNSPGGSICECCKPSIIVDNEGKITIMFRNNISGSRDMYSIESIDNGSTFSDAVKLGTGTWKIDGCPMDGGDLIIDDENELKTIWQREGKLFISNSSNSEESIGLGKSASISTNMDQTYITFAYKENVYAYSESTSLSSIIGKGSFPKVLALNDGPIYFWVGDNGINSLKVSD